MRLSVEAAIDFSTCEKANGSVIQQSYPEKCVTKDGRSFVESTAVDSSKYLIIKEWGVRLPLNDITADAIYSFSDKNMMVVNVSSKQLRALSEQVPGCKSGIDDIYLTRSKTVKNDGIPKIHVGAYY